MNREYIMSEDLYNQLCVVNGFTTCNGATYQEHIIRIAGDRIPQSLHCIIEKAVSGEEALQILNDNGVTFTHKFEESDRQGTPLLV